jgi:hypothetical protein
MAYHGVALMNPALHRGLDSIRRNPKRKGRLPYHAKKLFSIPIMAGNVVKCRHALAHRELLEDHRGRLITISYALPCLIGHKATTKNPTHKDSAKGVWK